MTFSGAPSSLWPWPHIVAHRLGGTLAPENTLGAMALAFRLGVRAMETDVMLTRDGAAVISHDPVFGRAVASAAAVADLSLKEIRTLDAGRLYSEAWRGEKVPTLVEVIDFAQTHGIFLNLEIKPSSEALAEATARETCRLVRKMYAGRTDTPLLSSFSRTALAAAQALAHDIPRGLLLEGRVPDWAEVAQALDVVTVHPDATADENFVTCAHEHGWGVMCWTIDDVQVARSLLTLGVDALCTNRPDRFGTIASLG